MNNKEFIAALSKRAGYKIDDTQRMVRSACSNVTDELMEGNSVDIAGLGTFEVRKRMERIIINPTSGQRMLVPPKLVVNFKACAASKERIK